MAPAAPLPRGKPALAQDPHRLREISARNLETAIGHVVRSLRHQRCWTYLQAHWKPPGRRFCACALPSR